MALNRCERKSCGALFSIGAPHCPQCGGKRFHEEGSEPAKKKPPSTSSSQKN